MSDDRLPPYLKKRGKRGIYRFWRRVPPALVGHFGFTFWDKSLRTSDLEQAKALVMVEAVATNALIKEARESATLAPSSELPALPDTADARGAVQLVMSDLAAEERQFAFLRAGVAMTPAAEDDELLSRVQKARVKTDDAEARAELQQLKAAIDDKVRFLKRLASEVDAAAVIARAGVPGLDQVLDTLAKDRALPEQTVRQYGYAVRRFRELHGDIAVSDLNRDHLKRFADAIVNLPATVPMTQRDRTIQEWTAIAEREPFERIAMATRAKHLTAIRTIAKHALADGLIADDPFAGFRLAKARVKFAEAKDERRKAFDRGDLKRILAALEAGTESTSADFWVPHVALYQGARVEEICQLERGDIVEVDSVWCFAITDAGEGQKVKNSASVRTIPIHPKLVDMGFLAFATPGQGGRVFADLKPDQRGRLAGPYGKRWARLLRNDAGITDSKKVFHSFRHTWTDAAKRAGVPMEYRLALAGREIGEAGSEKGYGAGYHPAILLEHLRTIDPLA